MWSTYTHCMKDTDTTQSIKDDNCPKWYLKFYEIPQNVSKTLTLNSSITPNRHSYHSNNINW